MYTARVRSVVEYAVQVYGCVINGVQGKALEDVQAHALQVVMGAECSSYSRNLATLELETLAERRENLMLKFAIKCFKSKQHSWWFTPSPSLTALARLAHPSPPRFSVPPACTTRQEKSPFQTYARLLNTLTDSEWEALGLPDPVLRQFRTNSQIQFNCNNRSGF